MSPADRLDRGLAELKLGLSSATRRRLLEYLGLLQKWNRVYNLTAVRDAGRMVGLHLLDSLAVMPHIAGRTILDVGSGAGLPGIPLALALNETQVTMLDSNEKKAAFLRQAAIELELTNTTIVCERVEAWRPPAKFDLVISRAFSDLGAFLAAAGRLCAPSGNIVAMKGSVHDEELARIPEGYRLRDIVPLAVPGLRAERHLVRMVPA
jgi:16S rRNA (guanine527-N7)-methyltransferase